MFSKTDQIGDFDKQIWQAIQAEEDRQEQHIELIASENYASVRVMQAQGSVLTNKYAEGYPQKRYYGGCKYVDKAEVLAIERAKQLFKADYVNVQPHSGSQANAAAYQALLTSGDTIMGMSLVYGGHLTHGSQVNFSGQHYRAIQYGLDDNGMLDYDAIQALAVEHQPKMIVAGFSAYSQVIDWARFRAIANSVNAYLLADIAHVAGLIVTGLYPNPVPHADVVTTTTHKTLRGPRGGLILARANERITKKLNSAVFPGQQGGPLMHVIAAKAVAFKEAMEPQFKDYQQQVIDNAKAMVQVFQSRGYKIISGGTENHLMLIDLIDKGISGKAADAALEQAHITVNKNAVPKDPRSPFVTSGIRVGTPAITSRGFGIEETRQLAGWMCDIMDHIEDQDVINQVRAKVTDLCRRFPVYR